MQKRGWAVGLIFVAAGFSAAAAPLAASDPLHSPACRQAMATLQTAERRFEGKGDDAGRTRIETAQREAARSCLRASAASSDSVSDPADVPAARMAQPPLAMPLPQTRPPVSPRAVLTPPAPVLPRPQAPQSITSCDALGCWANDGTRLQRNGATVLGPRGFCSVQGAVLSCP